MWTYPTGAMAFVLYFLYDINSAVWNKKWMRTFFALGTLFLLMSSAGCFIPQFIDGRALICRNRVYSLFLIPAFAGFACMIYSLFFALPFDETYVHSQLKTKVYDKGMYALCRHPGVLWFCLMYLGLALAWGTADGWCFGIMCSVLNICYVIFQDNWTFLKTFEDYEDYRKSTPFLIPTAKSAIRAWETRR